MSTLPGAAFRGSTQIEVAAVLATCGNNTALATQAIRTWIEAKQRKARSQIDIVAKLQAMELKYVEDASIHEAFHVARAETSLPRSKVLPPSRRVREAEERERRISAGGSGSGEGGQRPPSPTPTFTSFASSLPAMTHAPTLSSVAGSPPLGPGVMEPISLPDPRNKQPVPPVRRNTSQHLHPSPYATGSAALASSASILGRRWSSSSRGTTASASSYESEAAQPQPQPRRGLLHRLSHGKPAMLVHVPPESGSSAPYAEMGVVGYPLARTGQSHPGRERDGWSVNGDIGQDRDSDEEGEGQEEEEEEHTPEGAIPDWRAVVDSHIANLVPTPKPSTPTAVTPLDDLVLPPAALDPQHPAPLIISRDSDSPPLPNSPAPTRFPPAVSPISPSRLSAPASPLRVSTVAPPVASSSSSASFVAAPPTTGTGHFGPRPKPSRGAVPSTPVSASTSISRRPLPARPSSASSAAAPLPSPIHPDMYRQPSVVHSQHPYAAQPQTPIAAAPAAAPAPDPLEDDAPDGPPPPAYTEIDPRVLEAAIGVAR